MRPVSKSWMVRCGLVLCAALGAWVYFQRPSDTPPASASSGALFMPDEATRQGVPLLAPPPAVVSAMMASQPVTAPEVHPANAQTKWAWAQQRRQGQAVDPIQWRANIGNQEPIHLIDPAQAVRQLPFLKPEQQKDGRVFIAYNVYALETKFAGDDVDLLIPQLGASMRGKVERVEVAGPVVRWQGHFVDAQSNQTTFTISQSLRDNYAVATYATPSGIYGMEAKGGVGWIIQQRDDFHLPANGTDTLPSPTRP